MGPVGVSWAADFPSSKIGHIISIWHTWNLIGNISQRNTTKNVIWVKSLGGILLKKCHLGPQNDSGSSDPKNYKKY